MVIKEGRTKSSFNAVVIYNTAINTNCCRLRLELDPQGSDSFKSVIPGQFAEFQVSNASLPPADQIRADLRDKSQRHIILSRPFSFSDVKTVKGPVVLEITYAVVGPATVRMTTLAPGDAVMVTGPLGNGFSINNSKKLAVMIGGGIGTPPLEHLAKYILSTHPDMKIIFTAGAQSKEMMPLMVSYSSNGYEIEGLTGSQITTCLATDDGSAGYHGFVTDCARELIGRSGYDNKDIVIYSCGPEGMLSAASEIAKNLDIDCQLSMEQMMACGIGLCQSCIVKSARGDADNPYKLCCKDGPVFDSKDVIFE